MTAGEIRAVLFDLDGTLIDSERLILASYRHTMQAHLGHVPPEETWKATIGQPLVVQMKMFSEREDQAAAMIQTYVDHNLANHDDYVRPFPGVRSVLEALRESGVEVRTGVRAAEAEELNAAFLHFHRHGGPLVTLKAAITLDGMLSAAGGRSGLRRTQLTIAGVPVHDDPGDAREADDAAVGE